jgi:hypothetical protein
MSTPTLYGTAHGAGPVSLTPAQRLAADAAAAAEVRSYQTDPDVVALRVEHFRSQVDHLMWAGIVLGLLFTMTSVQTFAAAGAAVGSLAWWSAWLLDPMVSLVLLAVLRAEQVTTRYQVNTGPWPRITKWALLGATYVMNTWVFWAAGSASGVVLHSVPPLVVVLAAEAVTDLQHALTECVHRAHTAAHHAERAVRLDQSTRVAVNGGVPDHPPDPVPPPDERIVTALGTRAVTGGERVVTAFGERAVNSPEAPSGRQSVNPPAAVAERRMRPAVEPRPKPGKRAARRPVRRKLLADYLADARTAWAPGVLVTPAWVRQVTDCSRGLSSKVAAALNAELPPSHQHTSTDRTEPEGRAA